jgi:two-component system cell cycle sensor histidine kinase/response regulator CckA
MPDDRIRILNVDDDESIRRLKAAWLEDEGFDVLDAATGTEALELARRFTPAIVLLDINLPDIDGYKVCERLRAMTGDPAGIVHITAMYVSPDDWRKSVECGADSYLIQPIEPAILVRTIRTVLQRRSAELAARRERDRLIAEQRELEAQLRQSQKMEALGHLAGGIAHDFNNFLTAILGYAELMTSQIDADKPIHADLREITRAAQSAAALTRKLLAFSRKQVLTLTQIDLGDVVCDLEHMLRRVLDDRIDVRVDATNDAWPIIADGPQLEQVLLNLALNAQDAMADGGTLTLRVRNVRFDSAPAAVPMMSAGEYVQLDVADTGDGIDDATQARLFEPFFTTKPSGKGTGLGLAMVYGTVKQLHGYISVESTPGQGATFSIFLPRATPAVHTRGLSQDRQVGPVGDESIIVIEDEGAVRQITETALRRHGYSVVSFDNGEDALRHAIDGERDLHLVLSDVQMPGVTGVDVVKRLRASGSQIPVLLMSGYSMLIERGVDDWERVSFLQKPFTPVQLLKSVRDAIDM